MLSFEKPLLTCITFYNKNENDKYSLRATYYIFCCRNRNWDGPDVMKFWFLNIQSQAVNCELPKKRYMARFNYCNFKKTNKVFIIIIIIIILLLLVLNWGEHYTLNWWNPGVQHLWFLWKKKERFSSRPGAKVSCQGPPGAATAPPWYPYTWL